MNESEADGDLVLVETSLLFVCKLLLSSMHENSDIKKKRNREVSIKTSHLQPRFHLELFLELFLGLFRARKASCQTAVRRTAV